ncbi:response regulator [Ponticaulis sp.]|uniref:response regulator n=1 Tax=Ponticaulis sp. TaxID=2020902 RepID=UPI002601E892|nr:response regulator [Ponticaulis sp.]MDF1681333.1 response regulator [Ponticaulis sp.]
MTNVSVPSDIVKRYCHSLPAQFETAAQMLLSLVTGPVDDREVHDLYGELHRMAGTAQCMGFPFFGDELAKIVYDFEKCISGGLKADKVFLGSVATRFDRLSKLLEYVTTRNSLLLRDLEPLEGVAETRFIKARYQQVFSAQRVLYCDDDPALQQLMSVILNDLGVKAVETASDGRELLHKALKFKPNLVITDWQMSPMDGLQLLRYIRQGKSAIDTNCPIIFLSTVKTVNKIEQVVGEGVARFLVKPFNKASIARAIYQIASPDGKSETKVRKSA